MTSHERARWRIADGQRLQFEEFEDGTVMFDSLLGATHLLNATAAQTLDIVAEHPGLDTADVHLRVCRALALDPYALPQAAISDLLDRLEDLNIVSVLST